MELLEGIFKRRSIRKYTGQPVGKDVVDDLLKAGMYAPSACNKRPWHFVVISDQKIFDEIIAIHPHARMQKGADCAILVCADEIQAHDKGYWPVDCGAATQNILLAALAKGLGACWIGIYPRAERVAGVKRLLNLPEHIHAYSLISLGYPAETPNQPDRYDASKVHYEKW